MSSSHKNKIRKKIEGMPASPGVYFFKNQRGQVIYVGKARKLVSRVRSYMQAPEGLDPKTRALMDTAESVDYIVTDNEVEALVLEASMVREYRPRYNIRLKDDKRYPYLKITSNEEFPRLLLVRRVLDDGAEYFGPYTDAGAVRRTLKAIKTIFPLRDCKGSFRLRQRECLNFQIGRCLGPCTGKVASDEYAAVVRQLRMFLRGHSEALVEELRNAMESLSTVRRYEEASLIRDQISSIRKISERQHAVDPGGADEDAVAIAREGGNACGVVMRIREGRILSSEAFMMPVILSDDITICYEEFFKLYYNTSRDIPPGILTQYDLPDGMIISRWLRERTGKAVSISVPSRGHRRKLVDLAEKNAASRLLTLLGRKASANRELADLKKALGLPSTPTRLEAFDISNVQGTGAVGSMVTFVDGRPLKSGYRHFRIRTVDGQDDFAMMSEVLLRRFERLKDGKSRKPDLILVDGGKGQVSAAMEAMHASGLSPISVIGLAKRNEEIFVPGERDPIVLSRRRPGLKLLQKARDEAHRFAVEYHRKLRSHGLVESGLDGRPGVGEYRKTQLLVRFGSLEGLKSVSEEDIASVPGIGPETAGKIYEYIQRK
ncbi:MAG: excinuclease ABC subunit UvrC [Candidatus Krumholzibacteria bacterium]|nr:excinuclease ABC subunit UvrC [Candidatus Krumholzibacteria bacterium]